MPYQLGVVRFSDILPVSAVPGFVVGAPMPTLQISGKDFSSAAKVSINDIPCPEFIIVNKSTIWAQMPDGIDNISSIEVLSSRLTKNSESSKVSFEIGNKTQKVSGIFKLSQLFTKWILQSPGSDVFNPTRGGGLQQIIGQVTTSRNMDSVMASLTRAVDVTATQIRAAQAATSGLPLEERLVSATLLDVNIYEKLMEARARVSLENMAGMSALAAVDL